MSLIKLHTLLTGILLLFFSIGVRAQFEEGIEMPVVYGLPALKGSNLAAHASNTTQYSNQGEYRAGITNIISFKLHENEGLYFKSNFSADVLVDLELTDSNGVVSTRSVNLKVRYDKAAGSRYAVRDYVSYKDYRKVKITVNTVTVSGAVGWDPKAVLEVENEMRIRRYYNLSGTSSDLAATLSSSQPTSDVLEIKWGFPINTQTGMSRAGENMSQLEWAYVEGELEGYYSGNMDLLFTTNSSRVDLGYSATGYSYNIPLLYPGPGKLYYRVRAVQKKSNGQLICGDWSPVSGSQNSYSFAGHEDNLNWSSSTAFSDGGKYRSVIQYYDGSLRGRQTVSKDNTTGNTVVGETIYDLQGRAGLQILPTPTTGTVIRYFAGFNRFEGMGSGEDPARYFDLTPVGVNRCDRSPRLDSSAGNGRYYSANNDWLGIEAKSKYIPGAGGYGYAETRFMDDGTGRVRSQGGVGPDHQIGSGHEIKYYYGKPSQAELDALFGTEVGDASHYNKSMVRDPDGQMSVSYTDMHGRTIATALAGDAPEGIESIVNNSDYPLATGMVRNDLLTASTNQIQGSSIISVSTLLAPATTEYRFTYALTPPILQLLNCSGQPVCYDCKYDLEISIRSETCGQEQAVIKRYNNLQLVAPGSACTTSMGFTGEGITMPVTQINFDTTLAAGSYIISKKLTINDSVFRIRREEALAALLCRTREQIMDSVYGILQGRSGCNNSPQQVCDSCVAHLGSYQQYRTRYLASIYPATATEAVMYGQYRSDSAECANSCGTGLNPQLSSLKGLRDQLLKDMTPFTGQYAIDTVVNSNGQGDLSRLEAKYNIFTKSYTGNGVTITTGKPYYRKPQQESGQPYYFTDNNTVDSTIHGYNGGIVRIIDSIGRYPFAGIYQEKWSESLIKYHPEYSKLAYAETALKPSYEWQDKVGMCPSYQAASLSAANYINPLVSDPYFLLSSTQADKDTLNHLLNVGVSYQGSSLSLWQIANGSVLCATTDSMHRYGCMLATKKDGIDPGVTSTQDRDIVWERFKTLYLSYRNEMVVRYINNHTPNGLGRTDMNKLLSEGKQLVFAGRGDIAAQYGYSWWAGVSTSGDTTGVGVYINNNSIDNCEGQRPFWRNRLLQCETLKQRLGLQTNADSAFVNTVINKILDSLVMICHNTLNSQQPYGSSTSAPAYTGNPKRFEDVVNNVFAANGIATLPGDKYYCNPFSIDFPKPYGLNPAIAINYVNTIDNCGCRRFGELQQEAASLGYNATSLSSMNQFLQAEYNDTLSQVLWNGLQRCSGVWVNICDKDIKKRPAMLAAAGLGESREDCPRPVITGIYRTPGSTAITVYYQSPSLYSNCVLYQYDMSGNELSASAVDCGGGQLQLKISDTCQSYKFILESSGGDCDKVSSEPMYYKGCKDECLVYVPVMLPEFTVLPAVFACGYIKPCISCDKLGALTEEFKQLYPAYNGVPYVNTTTTDGQVQQNGLWARFLNFRTGFGKTALEYQGAYKNCKGATQPGNRLCAFDRPLNDPSDIYPPSYDPCRDTRTQAAFTAELLYEQMRDSVIARFDSLYLAKCLGAQSLEVFYVQSRPKEYHYTLYYYDQSGELVKTLPPAAVKPNYDAGYLAAVANARVAGTSYTNPNNNEKLATQYRYNSLGMAIEQRTPDAGLSQMWYDRLGRNVISQNAKQAAENKYSYTLYDELGRMMQVGQKPQSTAMTQTISQDSTALKNWLSDGGLKEQITRTVYDKSYYDGDSLLSPAILVQQNLRGRISYTQIIATEPANGVYAGVHTAATYYSYDIHGNIDTLVQDLKEAMAANPGNRYKKMVYSYELNGKLNKISYQPGMTDQFYHRYSYDDESRVVSAWTSHDGLYWEREVSYEFYRHGLISRMVIGQNQVQGIDYAYNLQGWVKGFNSSAVQTSATGSSYDMGQDGMTGGNTVARDAYGFSINYYSGDYKPIGGSGTRPFVEVPAVLATASDGVQTGRDLYGGNIRAMVVNIPKLGEAKLYGYRYDQLDRIKAMQVYAGVSNTTNQFVNGQPPVVSEDYKERVSYDPNGNIKTYLRQGAQSQAGGLNMDNLSYGYNKDAGGNLQNNRLRHVKDAIGNANYSEDTDNQPDDNYSYDQIGNLIADQQEGISQIDWTAYGKIASITKTNGTVIRYGYDIAANRISKEVTTGGVTKKTVYVRDGCGNVMGLYVTDASVNGGVLTQSEISLYSSSRVGLWYLNRKANVIGSVDYSNYRDSVVRGNKVYELNNHLQNVLVTVSDKKLQVDADGNGTLDYYTAEVVTATDYYPFGMDMPGRTFAASARHRYGFNGKENDPETGTQDYGMRIYNPKIAKFLSVDPLTAQYPDLTPYQFASNTPIESIDLDGLESQSNKYTLVMIPRSLTCTTYIPQLDRQWTLTYQNINRPAAQNGLAKGPVPVKAMGFIAEQRARKQANIVKVDKAADQIMATSLKRGDIALNSVSSKALGVRFSEVDPLYKNPWSLSPPQQPIPAGADLIAHGMASTMHGAYETGKSIVGHAVGFGEGIAEGNFGKTAGNGLLLAVDLSPLVVTKIFKIASGTQILTSELNEATTAVKGGLANYFKMADEGKMVVFQMGEGFKWDVWTQGICKQTGADLTALENAFDHWVRHSPEFGNIRFSMYVETAQRNLQWQTNKGLLVRQGAYNEIFVYDPAANTITIGRADGVPRTFYRPETGVQKFNNMTKDMIKLQN